MMYDYKRAHTWRQRHRFVPEEIACAVAFFAALALILLDVYLYFG